MNIDVNTKESQYTIAGALFTFITNPINGLPTIYRRLNSIQVILTGILFFMIYEIFCFTGAWIGKSQIDPSGQAIPNEYVLFFTLGLAIPVILLMALIAIVRLVTASRESFGADLLIATAAALPMSLWGIAVSIVGLRGWTVDLSIIIVPLCLFLIILYSGMAGIHRIARPLAIIIVPVVTIFLGWILQTAIVTIIKKVIAEG